jgi:hypothetical protein
MDAKRSGWLPLWILAPLVLFVAILLIVVSLPEAECGENTEGGIEEGVLVGVVAFAAVAAVAAGLYRLVTMAIRDQFSSRDGWTFLAALLVLAVTGVAYSPASGFGEGLAIGGLVLPALALLALVAAAVARKGVDAVGVLLPIYLFGAAYLYLVIGALGFLVSSGIGC